MTVSAETGPAFMLERINEAQLMALRTNTPLKDAPVLRLKDCSNILIQNAYPLPGSKAYAQFGGKNSKGIILHDNYLNRLETPVIKTDDLQPNAYILTE
jgi:hypothetical protein